MSKRQFRSRRDIPVSAGTLAALAAFPKTATAAGADITGRLARYMVAARDRPLPSEVLVACKHRILDTFGAMVSGARMKPGVLAVDYVRGLGGAEQATVIGASFRTTAVNAALANAMCGHADETDDFEPVTKAHPGCAVVPAALAIAEKDGRSGEEGESLHGVSPWVEVRHPPHGQPTAPVQRKGGVMVTV